MKKHQLKTVVLKALDILPKKLGFYFYYKIQSKSFKTISKFVAPNKASYEKIDSILTENGIQLKNKTILEIGSGWLPLLAYFLKIEGKADKVYTYDINKHYQQKNLDKCYEYMSAHYKTNIELTDKGGFKLPDFIEYHPFTNVINAELSTDIDVVVSRFVLEHVTPGDLVAINEKLYNSLPDNVYILHLISPSDHRAHSDGSISLYDFLKYSKKEWDRIQTKFDYHNRLRLPNYLDIFKNAGFEVVYVEHDSAKDNAQKYKKYKELDIHSDFNKYSEEELTAGSINVLLKKNISNRP